MQQRTSAERLRNNRAQHSPVLSNYPSTNGQNKSSSVLAMRNSFVKESGKVSQSFVHSRDSLPKPTKQNYIRKNVAIKTETTKSQKSVASNGSSNSNLNQSRGNNGSINQLNTVQIPKYGLSSTSQPSSKILVRPIP